MESTDYCLGAEVKVHRVLEIKEIVEHILGFLKLDDLKQSRLVSTCWRDSSVKSFKTFSVKLTSAAKTTGFLRVLNDPRPPRGSRAQLYSSFIFSNSSLNVSSRRTSALWTLSGSQIKSLELSDIKLNNVNELRSIVFRFCPNLKNVALRRVSLVVPSIINVVEPSVWTSSQFGFESTTVTSLTIDQYVGSLGISWMEFVNYFPSLKILRVDNAFQYHHKLFEAIILTRLEDRSKLVLREIHCLLATQEIDLINVTTVHTQKNYLAVKVLELLTKTNLQLRALFLDLSGGDKDVYCNLLVDILELERSSLEKLGVCRRASANFDPITFHRDRNMAPFQNLQELELISEVFTSMWIVKLFPNLKKLSFKQNRFDADEQFFLDTDLEGFQLPSCLEINHNGYIVDFSMEKLNLLLNTFMNVQRLKIPLNNEMLCVVCQQLPHLIELDIHDSMIDGSGLTGMTPEDVKNINVKRGNWRPIAVPRANITCLKRLKTLKLCITYCRPRSLRLGYCAKMLGFCALQNLEYLWIKNYYVNKRAFNELFIGNRKIQISIT